MNAGLPGIARTLSIAASRVARASGLAGLEKPMWLSEIWTKENPLSAALAEPMRREAGTPPATVHRTPVPAQSMHLRVSRRSRPPASSLVMGLSSIGDKRRPEERLGRGTVYSPGEEEISLSFPPDRRTDRENSESPRPRG